LTGADTAVAAGITATGHALLEAPIGDDGAGETQRQAANALLIKEGGP
jgi:hypothetical protein